MQQVNTTLNAKAPEFNPVMAATPNPTPTPNSSGVLPGVATNAMHAALNCVPDPTPTCNSNLVPTPSLNSSRNKTPASTPNPKLVPTSSLSSNPTHTLTPNPSLNHGPQHALTPSSSLNPTQLPVGSGLVSGQKEGMRSSGSQLQVGAAPFDRSLSLPQYGNKGGVNPYNGAKQYGTQIMVPQKKLERQPSNTSNISSTSSVFDRLAKSIATSGSLAPTETPSNNYYTQGFKSYSQASETLKKGAKVYTPPPQNQPPRLQDQLPQHPQMPASYSQQPGPKPTPFRQMPPQTFQPSSHQVPFMVQKNQQELVAGVKEAGVKLVAQQQDSKMGMQRQGSVNSTSSRQRQLVAEQNMATHTSHQSVDTDVLKQVMQNLESVVAPTRTQSLQVGSKVSQDMAPISEATPAKKQKQKKKEKSSRKSVQTGDNDKNASSKNNNSQEQDQELRKKLREIKEEKERAEELANQMIQQVAQLMEEKKEMQSNFKELEREHRNTKEQLSYFEGAHEAAEEQSVERVMLVSEVFKLRAQMDDILAQRTSLQGKLGPVTDSPPDSNMDAFVPETESYDDHYDDDDVEDDDDDQYVRDTAGIVNRSKSLDPLMHIPTTPDADEHGRKRH